MLKAAAVWLLWPCCFSLLLNQPDISGECFHRTQRGLNDCCTKFHQKTEDLEKAEGFFSSKLFQLESLFSPFK